MAKPFSDSPAVVGRFQQLKANLLLAANSHPPKAVGFASALRKEGTSVVVARFASELAQDGRARVLLVDGNLRDPSLHKAFKVKRGPGLSDLLLGRTEMGDAVVPVRPPGLFLAPCGELMSNPLELFKSERYREFLVLAREAYDLVIFDSPPVNLYLDLVAMAACFDGVILVLQAEKTPRAAVEWAQKQLKNAEIQLFGVVLNRRRQYIPGFLFRKIFGGPPPKQSLMG